MPQVSRRIPETTRDRDPVKSSVRKTEPYLEGIQLGDRYAVIFSPYDISCAGKPRVAGVRGLHAQDAARLGSNILLYSLHQ